MRKLIYSVSCALALTLFASTLLRAQNIDPTVVVTNSFQTKLAEVHKPQLNMFVPDSVNNFNLNFDYSVFDKPYKGSYEFSPYLLNMKPVQGSLSPRKLYLNAGVGYSLHPEVDLVWTPLSKKSVSLDIYAGHHSYFGRYQDIRPLPSRRDPSVVDFRQARGENNKRLAYKGYDMDNSAGLDFRYDWDSVTFVAGGGYEGIMQKDHIANHNYNEADAYLRLYSKSLRAKRFIYDLLAKYSYSSDKTSSDKYPISDGGKLNHHAFDFKGTLGAGLTDSSKVAFDFGVGLNAYSGIVGHNAASIFLVPHYVLNKNGWSVDLGVRVSYISTSREESVNNKFKSQLIYPAVNIAYNSLKAAMRIELKLGGGEKVNSYSQMMRDFGHYYLTAPMVASQLLSSEGTNLPLMDNSVERVNLSLGIYGRIGKHFGYNLKGGYILHGNAPVDRIFMNADGVNMYLIDYMGYNEAFASVGLFSEWDWVRLGGNFIYRYTDISDNIHVNASGLGHNHEGCLAPAAFSGDASAVFNIRRRIFMGVNCEFASVRKTEIYDRKNAALLVAQLPSYADLGVFVEYQFSRRLSFWLKGGNLLCMSVQRTPLYAESGLSFTGGIRFNL